MANEDQIRAWTTNNQEQLKLYFVPANKSNEPQYKLKVYSDDEFVTLDVYRIPTKILSYNFDNVRISAEKEKLEYDQRRELDPTNAEDQKAVENILYKSKFYSKTATPDLEKDIEDHDQEEPAIISADGVVWNGNRRLAIRNRLFARTGLSKYLYVNAVKLPENLSHKELKKLERRLQMHKDWKQDYGSIQTRLDVRYSLNDRDWTMQEIVASYGDRYDEETLTKFKEEIDLIDEYLERIKRPKDYVFVESGTEGASGVEIFTTLNNLIKKEEKKQTDPLEIEKIKLAGFRIKHRPKSSYEDMRDFSKVMSNPQGRLAFIKNSPTFQNFNEITKSGNEFDTASISKEYDNLDETTEIVKNSTKDAAKIAEKALSILQGIREDKIPKDNKEFKDILKRLQEMISRLQSKS